MATHRVRRIDPFQAAKMAGILYGLLGLIFVPFFLMIGSFAPSEVGMRGFGTGMAIVMPILYAVFGAIGTAIGAGLYNLVAGWVGGLEIELE